MPRRPTLVIRDALLLAASAAVIALAVWPPAAPRRLLTVRTPGPDGRAGMKRYSLPAGSSELDRLRVRIDRWGPTVPIQPLAITRWRRNLAKHYAESVEGPNAERLQAYWSAQAAAAERALARISQETERRRQELGSPPVRIGGLARPAPTPASFAAAAAAALMVVTAFWLWTRWQPPIVFNSPSVRSGSGEATDPGGAVAEGETDRLAVRIPETWIAVRQPAGVTIRRVCTAALVVVALGSLLA